MDDSLFKTLSVGQKNNLIERIRRWVCIVEDEIQCGQYKYLLTRYSVKYKDLPDDIEQLLADHDTFAAAGDEGIVVSPTQLLKQICVYIKFKDKNHTVSDVVDYITGQGAWSYNEMPNLIRNTIVHEFGHIIHGHIYMKRKNDKYDTLRTYTKEIETNRDVWNEPNRISIFFTDTAVSDTKPQFQCTQPYMSFTGIFNKLKEIQDKNTDKQQNGGQSQNNNQEQNNPTQGGNESNSQNENNNANGEDTNGNSKDAFQNKNIGMGQKIKDNVVLGQNKMTSNETFDNERDAKEHMLRELGIQPTEEMLDADNAQMMLAQVAQAYNTKEIKRVLRKIKGELRGDLSRDKVGTYSRQSRKQSCDGMLQKGKKYGMNKKPRILVALDASSSMNSVAVKNVSGAIYKLMKTLGRNKTDMDICIFNTDVRDRRPASEYDEIIKQYKSDGGTRFDMVMHEALKTGADVVLNIGDGEATLKLYDFHDIKKYEQHMVRWYDILITPLHNIISHLDNIQKDVSEDIKHRETYWIGSDKKAIMDALSDV